MKLFPNRDHTGSNAAHTFPAGAAANELRTAFAIGTLTLIATIVMLVLVNMVIVAAYHPDVSAIVQHITSLSFYPAQWFAPEPVERLQFQVSVMLLPVFIVAFFMLFGSMKAWLLQRPLISRGISIAALLAFGTYLTMLLREPLVMLPEQTNASFFDQHLIMQLPLLAIPLYVVLAVLACRYYGRNTSGTTRKITAALIYVAVALLVGDLVLYDVFYLAKVDMATASETNPVFYAITQVYAGKTMLVDQNCLYGMYPWVLLPVFKIIGLSVFKIGLVLAVLNGLAFLFFFLGIRKTTGSNVAAFLVFACMVFWQFWGTRLPLAGTPRFYYQYDPVRTLFPAIVFFLVASMQAHGAVRRWRLALLSAMASLAVLWNLDVGVVVFAAACAAVPFMAGEGSSRGARIRTAAVRLGYMVLGLCGIFTLFFVTAKVHSGSWPHLQHFYNYQQIFYISGFFMLPMKALHFWNIPALVYVISGIFIVARLAAKNTKDLPIALFLFVLGIGLFAYFQGRSYDTTVGIIMYPAILLLGLLSFRLLDYMHRHKLRASELTVYFVLPFLLLADGAASMLWYVPATHSYAWNNAFEKDEALQGALDARMSFINQNLPAGDTVLFIVQNYESYYYAEGQYYNPVHLPGSTEIFFHSEIDTLLHFIRRTSYPMVLDARYYWPGIDSILTNLARYTTISKMLPPDYNTAILMPRKQPLLQQLRCDTNTLYYKGLGAYSRFSNEQIPVHYPGSFTIDAVVPPLDSAMLQKDNLMLVTQNTESSRDGIMIKQDGDDLAQYAFVYGNGIAWSTPVHFRLSYHVENHIKVKVNDTRVTVSNNGQENTVEMAWPLQNNDSLFFFGSAFPGVIAEIRINKQ